MEQALNSLGHTSVVNRDIFEFSTHEHHDRSSSIVVAYAKAARMFERHIDLVSITRHASAVAVRQDAPITIELVDAPDAKSRFSHQKIAGRRIDAPQKQGGSFSGAEGLVKPVSG